MNRLLAAALCSALALPAVAFADKHGHPPPPAAHGYRAAPPPASGYRVWGAPRRLPPPAYVYRPWVPRPVRPVYVYRPYPVGCYGYGCYRYKDKSDNDDAWWALGGLVTGVIIGTAINNQSYAPPPPPPR